VVHCRNSRLQEFWAILRPSPLVQYQLKLRLTGAQKKKQRAWLPILGSIFNFGIRKIELNARNKIYFSARDFQNLLAGHSEKLEIPSHTIQGVLSRAHDAWQRCFKGLARKPRLKGMRRPLNSIPFPDPIKAPVDGKILPGFGRVRFHKQWIPEGKIKCGRLVKRASGDYLCLFIDAQPKAIERTGEARVGIDPGFKDLITLSTGEQIAHPQESRNGEKRFGQAQRGHDRKLAGRLQERIKSRRKDRNHKLSRRLVAENCFLQDNHRAVAKRFGKSVGDSAHGGLRIQLSYKSLAGGTELIFPENRNSTRTCSTCGAITGPTGLAGLKVREWDCGACGAHHERDVNAARNALISGLGWSHETVHAWA
jgi:putative transposase